MFKNVSGILWVCRINPGIVWRHGTLVTGFGTFSKWRIEKQSLWSVLEFGSSGITETKQSVVKHHYLLTQADSRLHNTLTNMPSILGKDTILV